MHGSPPHFSLGFEHDAHLPHDVLHVTLLQHRHHSLGGGADGNRQQPAARHQRVAGVTVGARLRQQTQAGGTAIPTLRRLQ